MNRKRGFTILELLVSMTIFLTLTTLLIGAYVAVVRTKGLATTRKETEQKTRIALEMISRLSKQANKVKTTNDLSKTDGETRRNLFLYFEDEGNGPTVARFYSATNQIGLLYYECPKSKVTSLASTNFCTGNWVGQGGIDLFAGTLNNRIQVNSAIFTKDGGIPASLKVDLDLTTIGPNAYYTDNLSLSTQTILENLK